MERLSCSKRRAISKPMPQQCVRFAAKLKGVDPEAYPWGVLDRIASGHPISRTVQLIPWNSASRGSAQLINLAAGETDE